MRDLVRQVCDAAIEQVRTGADALERIEQRPYHLVLINRTLDGPMDGLSLLAKVRALSAPPISMLISNYSDAQKKAVELGAVPGFGRAQMDAAISLERLRAALEMNNASDPTGGNLQAGTVQSGKLR
jgi:CheY-like chemotaxis protein